MEQLTELLNNYSNCGLPEQTGLLSFGVRSASGTGESNNNSGGNQNSHCPVHGILNSTSGFGPLRKQRSQQLHPLRVNIQLQHQHSASATFASSHSPPADFHLTSGSPLASQTSLDFRPDLNNNNSSTNLSPSLTSNTCELKKSNESIDSSFIGGGVDKDRLPSDRSDSVDCAGCLCNECGCVERVLYLEKHWRSLVASHGISLPNKLQNQQDAIWELLNTELFYIRRLKVISDLFLNCLCNLQSECLLNDVRISLLPF
jgi:hypothetical protein